MVARAESPVIADPFFRRITEIDALRAIAIIGVVGSHISGFKGGFLGVDLFFVISGYVIMLSTLKNLDDGKFSFLMFYHHRIRRIIPPLFGALAFIYLISRYIFIDNNDFSFIIDSYKFQTFFLQNYYYVGKALDYFKGLEEAKLVIHLWSIAVEEQFYIIFPLILVFYKRSWNNVLFYLLLCLLAAVSLCVMMDILPQPRSITVLLTPVTGEKFDQGILNISKYYLIYSRFWELCLGIGACLVSRFIDSRKMDLTSPYAFRFNRALTILNLGIIVYSMYHASPEKAWPNLFSLFPTLSVAVLMIQFHLVPDRFTSHIFNTPVLQVTGKASYSVYLYHFPIYGVLKYANSDFGIQFYDYVFYLVVLSVFSGLSYVFIEKSMKKINVSLSFAVLALFVVSTYAASYSKQMTPEQRTPRIRMILETGSLVKECTTCVDDPKRDFLILWGDSHANMLLESIESYCRSNNMDLVKLGKAPMIPVEKSHKRAVELMHLPNFKGMILAARWSMYIKFPDDEPEEKGNRYFKFDGKTPSNESEATDVFKQSFARLLEEIQGVNAVIVLDPPRYAFFPKKEALMNAMHLKLRPLNPKTPDDHRRDQGVVNAIIEEEARKHPSVTLVDPASVLCSQGGCTWRDGDRLIYSDDDHLSVYGAQKIMPLIKEKLDGFIGSKGTEISHP